MSFVVYSTNSLWWVNNVHYLGLVVLSNNIKMYAFTVIIIPLTMTLLMDTMINLCTKKKNLRFTCFPNNILRLTCMEMENKQLEYLVSVSHLSTLQSSLESDRFVCPYRQQSTASLQHMLLWALLETSCYKKKKDVNVSLWLEVSRPAGETAICCKWFTHDGQWCGCNILTSQKKSLAARGGPIYLCFACISVQSTSALYISATVSIALASGDWQALRIVLILLPLPCTNDEMVAKQHKMLTSDLE